ncbi:MAG: hypothetical protein ACT4PT_04355 [Methanobacteriota archaeon]
MRLGGRGAVILGGILLLAPALAGCLGTPASELEDATVSWTPCAHPYPCGDE